MSLQENLGLITLLEEFIKEEGSRCRSDLSSSDPLVHDGVDEVGIGDLHRVDGQEREVVLLLEIADHFHRRCSFTCARHSTDVKR